MRLVCLTLQVRSRDHFLFYGYNLGLPLDLLFQLSRWFPPKFILQFIIHQFSWYVLGFTEVYITSNVTFWSFTATCSHCRGIKLPFSVAREALSKDKQKAFIITSLKMVIFFFFSSLSAFRSPTWRFVPGDSLAAKGLLIAHNFNEYLMINFPFFDLAKYLTVRSSGCDSVRFEGCNYFCVTCLTQAQRNPLECPSHGPAEPLIGKYSPFTADPVPPLVWQLVYKPSASVPLIYESPHYLYNV